MTAPSTIIFTPMSAKWIAKAVIQKAISFLPQPERANLFFQKHVTGGVYLTGEHFTNKITHARDHIAYLKKYRQQTADSRQQTADSRQQTADSRQQTADSRQQNIGIRNGMGTPSYRFLFTSVG